MNSLFGIIRWDGYSVSSEYLRKSIFKSPFWEPDHQQIWTSGSVGIVCTQRFITPQCQNGKMPFIDSDSGCMVVGDFFLTNRNVLLTVLNGTQDTSDVALILRGYLKWGEAVFSYLFGHFMVVIWDPRIQKCFIGVDGQGSRPCLYRVVPGKYLMFSNTLKPFTDHCVDLTINPDFFSWFALDSVLQEGSCYTEIKRILPAHYLAVSSSKLKIEKFWMLKKNRRQYPYRTREAWFEAFRVLFREVVYDYLRTEHGHFSHISGGLDSSSVSAMAARILQDTGTVLHGFTAIPNELSGASYRRGWMYHELPLVKDFCSMYPNVLHTVYTTPHPLDFFKELEPVFPYIDQPVRNVQNFDWFLASTHSILRQGGRTLLTGQRGNGSISWAGNTWTEILKERINFYRGRFSYGLTCQGPYYACLSDEFKRTQVVKDVQNYRCRDSNLWYLMLNGLGAAERQSGLRPFFLWTGVDLLDPTSDRRLLEFCYSAPQWVFQSGKGLSNRRQLVRKGLEGILNESIRKNIYRGEQSPDWAQGFNVYYLEWKAEVENFREQNPEHFLFKIYDYDKVMALFTPVVNGDYTKEISVGCFLIRFISAIKFLRLIS